MELNEKIKYYRKRIPMTQSGLADKSGISLRALSNYESGLRTPSLEILIKIAKALDVQVTDLDPNIPIWEEFDAKLDIEKLHKELKEFGESVKTKKEIPEISDENELNSFLEDQEKSLKKFNKIVKGIEEFTNIMVLFNSKEKEIITELIKVYNSAVFEKSYDVNKLNDEQYKKLKQNIRNSIKESFEEFENK